MYITRMRFVAYKTLCECRSFYNLYAECKTSAIFNRL